MYIEVRSPDHLDYLKNAIRYSNMMKGNNCLNVDFYYPFRQPDDVNREELIEEYSKIVDILISARAYKKLAVGCDELHAKSFPPEFFTLLLTKLIEK